MSISAGDRLGAYEILSRLGAGGMGEVFRARDVRLERDVAIKVLPDHFKNDTASRKRFEREARAVAALNHSNILTIHDIGSEGGVDFVVTELLEGQTLRETMEHDGALPWRQALNVALNIARGLAASHAKHIIHRDIKPSNIFLTRDGGVKILDFGLAKSMALQPPPVSPEPDSARAEPMTTKHDDATRPGTLIGTIGYMSPEQARGLDATPASDVFALGCVLHEMLTGNRPFVGDTPTDTLVAIIKNEPEAVGRRVEGIPRDIEKTLQKMLRKDPADRYENGGQLCDALDEISASHAATTPNRFVRIAGTAAVVIVIALFVASLFRSSSRDSEVDQARNVALEEARALVDQEDWFTAFGILTEIEGLIPDDPLFRETLDEASSIVKIETDPPGADVAYKPYNQPDSEWIRIAASDLEAVRLPRGGYRWRIAKDGYALSEVARLMPHPVTRSASAFATEVPEDLRVSEPPRGTIQFKLYPENEVPEGMLPMNEARYETSINGLSSMVSSVGAYFIDRTEVTNASYREFVAAGGYKKPEFWKYPFHKDGAQLTFEQAIAELLDSTGRPGPAGWVLGDYPDGQDLYPVGGVSWYEAAAYAEFRGKSLPTIFHWMHAALSPTERTQPMAQYIIPASNFAGEGPSRVAHFTGMGYSGAYDLAGNVREWCLNPSGFERYSLGGGWEDPAYLFTEAQPLSPFERPPYQGFRCVIYPNGGKPRPETARNLEIPTNDFSTARPVSDDVFQIFRTQSSYAKLPLNAKIEKVEELPDAIREMVTVDAAYDNERLIIHLHLPLHGEPPYHALIWAPGANALMESKFRLDSTYAPVLVLPKSGRVLVAPVFAGTFERGGGPSYARFQNDPAWVLDMIFRWMKDLSRTIDYLETREDIITSDLAWAQISAGGTLGGMALSLNERFKVAISISGSLPPVNPQASTTPNFAFWSRVKIPVLMLNGRYDYLNPYETNVKVLFDAIGTSIEDKKLVPYDAGHVPLPRNQVIKEMIDWLDKYQTDTVPASDEAGLADSQTK
ncbi:MAG: protein kinase [Candidatus Hydrogenedentes bacterium]|nr:protein kinase [Candidatus Hydrogenedentota bacterium]